MDHFFTTYRKLQDELDDPCTQFMQSVLLEYEQDIYSGFNEEYESLTREQVDHLKLRDLKVSEEKYKQREDAFCESQVQKLEKEPEKRKRSLLNDTADRPDDGYVAGSGGLGEIFDSESEDSFLDIVEEELYYNKKKKDNKRTRKAQKHQFGYLAHRIERRVPEIFNARQFIRQAEDILRQKGGDALEAMNRTREVCYDPLRVTNDAIILTCVDFAKEQNVKDARAFDEQSRRPEDHMIGRESDNF